MAAAQPPAMWEISQLDDECVQHVSRPKVGEAELSAWCYLHASRSFPHGSRPVEPHVRVRPNAAGRRPNVTRARCSAPVAASTRSGVEGPEIFERPAGKRKLALIHFEWRRLEDRPVPLDVFTLHHTNNGGRFGEGRRPELWNVKGHGVGSGEETGGMGNCAVSLPEKLKPGYQGGCGCGDAKFAGFTLAPPRSSQRDGGHRMAGK